MEFYTGDGRVGSIDFDGKVLRISVEGKEHIIPREFVLTLKDLGVAPLGRRRVLIKFFDELGMERELEMVIGDQGFRKLKMIIKG